MEKSKLQSFITRYYLAGNCEAVTLNENETGIGCELIDQDQTVVGKIQWNTTPFVKGSLGINHTGALIKMLGAVGENIDINVQQAGGKNYAMKTSPLSEDKAELEAFLENQDNPLDTYKPLPFDTINYLLL